MLRKHALILIKSALVERFGKDQIEKCKHFNDCDKFKLLDFSKISHQTKSALILKCIEPLRCGNTLKIIFKINSGNQFDNK